MSPHNGTDCVGSNLRSWHSSNSGISLPSWSAIAVAAREVIDLGPEKGLLCDNGADARERAAASENQNPAFFIRMSSWLPVAMRVLHRYRSHPCRSRVCR